MFWLSDEAIEYAVFKCQNNPGYKVGIALNSRSKYNDVELCMRKCLKDTDDYIFRKGTNDKRIEFHNSSYIRIIPPQQLIRVDISFIFLLQTEKSVMR